MKKTSPTQIAYLFKEKMFEAEVEEFWAMALNPLLEVIDVQMLFRGTVDACLIHARDIFRFALKNNAYALVVAHNHPSGGNYPSEEDLRLTRNLIKAGKIMQIPLLDHFIITKDGFFSFAEAGLIRSSVDE